MELWKIDDSFYGAYKISNKQFPNLILSASAPFSNGTPLEMTDSATASPLGWRFTEVCEIKQEAFKPHTVPGTIECEDFDNGCPGDAYFDRDEANAGGKYRLNQPVDIDTCSAGGYVLGWLNRGEWTAYTVMVEASGTYQVSFYVAAPSDNAKIHLECDDVDLAGSITLPNTAGYQNWDVVKANVKLDAGQHVLKLFVDSAGLNLDKMVFGEIK